MLHLLPRPSNLPGYLTLLDDLGMPTAKRLAKALGVSERTVTRWKSSEQAPRAVMLALFWLSRWGQSALRVEAVYTADMARSLVDALTRERDELRAQLQRLGAIGDFGSSNDPNQLTQARRALPTATDSAGWRLHDQHAQERAEKRMRAEARARKRGRIDEADAA